MTKVTEPHPEYTKMVERWRVPSYLWGGALTMRANFEQLVPQEVGEEAEVYQIRRERAHLVNKYRPAITNISSKPYSKPVMITSELPEPLSMMAKNIDGAGSTLAEMGRRNFESGIHRGVAHFLTDMSANPGANESEQRNSPPRIIHVDASEVIGWEWKNLPAGDYVPVHVRIRRYRYVNTSTYVSEREEIIHQYDLVYSDSDLNGLNAQVFYTSHSRIVGDTQNDMGDFVVMGPTLIPNINRIPLSTWYTNEVDTMVGWPAMEDLAHSNHRHYQNYSSYGWVLRWAGVHQGTIAGINDEEVKKLSVAAVDKWVNVSDSDAKIGMLEVEGNGIRALFDDLKHNEAYMDLLSARPLYDMAASANQDSKRDQMTIAQNWVQNQSDALTDALRFAAQMVELDIGDTEVRVFQDFHVGEVSPERLQIIQTMRAARDIDHKTYLNLMQRAMILTDDADLDQIIGDTLAEREAERLIAESIAGRREATSMDNGNVPPQVSPVPVGTEQAVAPSANGT